MGWLERCGGGDGGVFFWETWRGRVEGWEWVEYIEDEEGRG